MGPLDGVWKATTADGQAVLDLVLSDRGLLGIEGALSLNDTTHTTVPVTASRSDTEAVVEASVGGRPVQLRLQRAADGWTGTLSGLGRDQAVSLSRPG